MADEGLEVIQSMIDISANRLERLRTQCATSAELTQQETRSLESKLVRMFCELLLTRQNLPDCIEIPASNDDLRQWLRVVGLSTQTINAVIQHVNTLETLLKMNDDDICAILTDRQTEETRRLMCAVNNLKRCQQCIKSGTEPSDMFWDSWDRRHNIRHSSSPKVTNNRLTTVIVNEQSVPDESLQSPIELSPPDTQNSSSSLTTSGTLTSSTDKLLHLISPEEGSGVSNLSPSPSPPQSPSVYNTTSQSSSGGNSRRLLSQKVHLSNNINNNIFRLNGSTKDMTESNISIGSNHTIFSNTLNNNDIEIDLTVDAGMDGMSKSKSNESQLSINGQKSWPEGSALNVSETSGETTPITAFRTRHPINANHHDFSEGYHLENHSVTPIIVSDTSAPPRSPCTPVRVMAHIIQHRFTKKFKFTTSTCDLCNKQMFFGYKCTECKYRCHKDCKSNVPPSCGLPKGMVDEFKKTLHNDAGCLMPNPSPNLHRPPHASLMPKKLKDPRHRAAKHNISFHHGADSSSNGSSCNSSSPSSPALLTIPPPQTPANKSQFNFPEVSSAATTNQNHLNTHLNSSYLPNTIIEDAEFELPAHSSKRGDGSVHLRNNFTNNYQHSLTSMINSEMENQPVQLNGSITDSNGKLLFQFELDVFRRSMFSHRYSSKHRQ